MSIAQVVQIQQLIDQHREGWAQFQRLRYTDPQAAYEVALVALEADRQLEANGVQVL